MKKNNQQSNLLKLLGLLMLVMELLVFFSKDEFNQLGEIGWLVHGSLIFLFGVMILVMFILSELVNKK